MKKYVVVIENVRGMLLDYLADLKFTRIGITSNVNEAKVCNCDEITINFICALVDKLIGLSDVRVSYKEVQDIEDYLGITKYITEDKQIVQDFIKHNKIENASTFGNIHNPEYDKNNLQVDENKKGYIITRTQDGKSLYLINYKVSGDIMHGEWNSNSTKQIIFTDLELAERILELCHDNEPNSMFTVSNFSLKEIV